MSDDALATRMAPHPCQRTQRAALIPLPKDWFFRSAVDTIGQSRSKTEQEPLRLQGQRRTVGRTRSGVEEPLASMIKMVKLRSKGPDPTSKPIPPRRIMTQPAAPSRLLRSLRWCLLTQICLIKAVQCRFG